MSQTNTNWVRWTTSDLNLLPDNGNCFSNSLRRSQLPCYFTRLFRQDNPVTRFAVTDMLNRTVDIRHLKLLTHRCNPLMSAKL